MIPFVKAHACGNDFLVMEETVAKRQHAALAKRLCSRNTSIGADGIEFLERKANGELFLRLFNADGSEAELSGNGTRCVAAWLAHSEGRMEATFGTHGGPRVCRVVEDKSPLYLIESEMGVPRVMPRTIVVPGVGDVEGAMVNVGNPHFVIFTDTEDFSAYGLRWQDLGAKISTSPLFPHGTNVEFVRVAAKDEIGFRIFERGCGPTTSSGTGTCASSAASMALRGVDRELTAVAEGGPQKTVWTTSDAVMLLTGPAEIICRGEAWGE
ncbi:MAG: diaminopimelate epimerase [Edaphobacter sp.]|uniref:diaminopimelate epimerase n=1 Tax=Edaphobacter sp. TaxID=1934404 RepID=UPI002392B8FF|nr:diaminopimelate epimerase [Edaphobacter sp.]MDE1177821.1 diaminopimelate epimerase [Edaphobacter sp.]